MLTVSCLLVLCLLRPIAAIPPFHPALDDIRDFFTFDDDGDDQVTFIVLDDEIAEDLSIDPGVMFASTFNQHETPTPFKTFPEDDDDEKHVKNLGEVITVLEENTQETSEDIISVVNTPGDQVSQGKLRGSCNCFLGLNAPFGIFPWKFQREFQKGSS